MFLQAAVGQTGTPWLTTENEQNRLSERFPPLCLRATKLPRCEAVIVSILPRHFSATKPIFSESSCVVEEAGEDGFSLTSQSNATHSTNP